MDAVIAGEGSTLADTDMSLGWGLEVWRVEAGHVEMEEGGRSSREGSPLLSATDGLDRRGEERSNGGGSDGDPRRRGMVEARLDGGGGNLRWRARMRRARPRPCGFVLGSDGGGDYHSEQMWGREDQGQIFILFNCTCDSDLGGAVGGLSATKRRSTMYRSSQRRANRRSRANIGKEEGSPTTAATREPRQGKGEGACAQ